MMIAAHTRTAAGKVPAFHFHPEANVGDGTTPTVNAIKEPELQNAPPPVADPAPQTDGDTGSTPDNKTRAH